VIAALDKQADATIDATLSQIRPVTHVSGPDKHPVGGRGGISPDRRKHSTISAQVANLGPYRTAVLFEVLLAVANRAG
jgi:hypothetical protein